MISFVRLPQWLSGKEFYDMGDLGSILSQKILERVAAYSRLCLGNPMDREDPEWAAVHGVTHNNSNLLSETLLLIGRNSKMASVTFSAGMWGWAENRDPPVI